MKIVPLSPALHPEWRRMRHGLWPWLAEDDEEPVSQEVFIALDDAGRPCGFVEAGERPYAEGCETSPVGYIEGWYVSPESRGRGVGRSLIEAAEQWARSRGLREMASDAGLDNLASHRAHERLGYREVERVVCFRKAL
jgi:aminoglycoside 6'-N-acetyltransferase I